MKTKLFRTEQLEEKDIDKLKNLQKTSDLIFDEIISWYLKQNEYPRINKELTQEFAEKTQSKAEDIINAFSSIYWLNNLFIEYFDDTSSDFIDDLKVIHPEVIIDEGTFIKRINTVSKVAKKYEFLIKTERTVGYGAPTLKSASTSVILKPVIEKRFDFDKQDIKDYKPKVLKNEPCVLIKLRDSNDNYLSFQMDSESFERYLNDMISLQIELNAVKDDCN